jgi:CRISPR-associated endonuclease/helicase Cas3
LECDKVTVLAVDDFADFFTALHSYPPFAWQSRLCQTIYETGEWPESISAPTGTGKSNVVDVHAFVNALYGWGSGPRVPRRLAVVVNRRAIVDAHEQRALDLQKNLRSPESHVVARVAEGLRRLQHESSPDSVIALATLRGGLIPDRSWIDDPASCTVICATPDMWGSRLLFGGFGSSPQARPREAGLLAFDSVMVLDEAHLNVQLLKTARRVRELIQRHRTPAPALQVVETTATPATKSDGRSVGVSPDDVASDRVLSQRLTRPKPLTYHGTASWPDKRRASDKYITEIVDVVIAMGNNASDGTVGCILNTVSTAVRVAAALRNRFADKPTRNQVLTWVGPMRPMDLAAQVEAYPLAFRPEGDDRVGVIVATQTIEVGVDIDLAALVTELAPGAAILQRAGRVNRLGSRETGPVVVIGPTGDTSASGPYDVDELASAREWVLRRATDPAGLSPLSVVEAADPAPAASVRRDVFARLEAGDIEALATTSEDLAAPQERSLWLRDDLEPDRLECGIVLRSQLPPNDLDALALLQATPPAAREKFPVRIQIAREVCRVLGEMDSTSGRAFAWKDNGVSQMQLGSGEVPKPGDTLILDSCHPIVLEHTIVDDRTGFEEQFTAWGTVDADGVAVEVLWRSDALALFEQIDDIVADSDRDPNAVQELVNDVRDARYQVTVGPPFEGEEDGRVPWLVLKPQRGVIDDEETRQTWSGTAVVTLDAHSAAVAARARSIALHLSLTDNEADALELAGLYHDVGKMDHRFQLVLGAQSGEPFRAKSGGASSRRAQIEKSRAGLPLGWRHEQLSVALTRALLEDQDADQRDLVLRLVGTSHGRGRSAFPHGATNLIDPQEPGPTAVAIELFDRGGWDELIENTHRRLGPWACALYEALLRAADCTVSKEGS